MVESLVISHDMFSINRNAEISKPKRHLFKAFIFIPARSFEFAWRSAFPSSSRSYELVPVFIRVYVFVKTAISKFKRSA